MTPRRAGEGHSSRGLPPYAYRPGRTPHPRRHPDGHSHGRPEPRPAVFPAEAWPESREYVFALELFHAGFWWESHEILEALWHAFGRESNEGRLLRALILAAGAELKRAVGQPAGARRLASRAVGSLAGLPPGVLGVDVPALAARVEQSSTGPRRGPIRIPLLGAPRLGLPPERG